VVQRLHARPNLNHLKKQAKVLQAQRGAGFRLADAQWEIARAAGFESWPRLVRHVDQLRRLEGEWTFAALDIDGVAAPSAVFDRSRILIDGDRFRTESPDAIYDGVFTIDTETTPRRIDVDFVEGPEAGHRAEGIFELDGDDLTICLGLVGAARPGAFTTSKGSGHALERLRRRSAARPLDVTGGTRPPASTSSVPAAVTRVDVTGFDTAMTPLLRAMEGEWRPTLLVRAGEPMSAEWLAYGSRIGSGHDVKVVFGGQTIVHARVRIDDAVLPVAIDYLGLSGPAMGQVSLGIMDWVGDELRVHMAAPGDPRPADFTPGAGSRGTLSQWRRR